MSTNSRTTGLANTSIIQASANSTLSHNVAMSLGMTLQQSFFPLVLFSAAIVVLTKRNELDFSC